MGNSLTICIIMAVLQHLAKKNPQTLKVVLINENKTKFQMKRILLLSVKREGLGALYGQEKFIKDIGSSCHR